eukprot:TRINITY_DN32360_c0_g1_i1.p1 TRINITY_DN32360_c0_g1~~TRINITY_DN32360_c0_g1_i1.p1  ORF type:complete len:177 (+),score=39.06 TRINITY_DN32360_c0_g1_i1:3-533(+)
MAVLRAALKAARRAPAASVLHAPNWPAEWPFEARHFQRFDEEQDSEFYQAPRLVTHVDSAGTDALTRHYGSVLRPGDKVLDLCSSWVSHYPADWEPGEVVGLGMNFEELDQNPILDQRLVLDLNAEQRLPFPDGAFDIATVSYTHLRAHETPEHLVCRLLLEKKKKSNYKKHRLDI